MLSLCSYRLGSCYVVAAWNVGVLIESTTTVSSAPNPADVAQSVTLFAEIMSVTPQQFAPTGTVIFSEGTATLCSASLSSGHASCPTSFSTAGTHNIIAKYSGDAHIAGSVSQPYRQMVVAQGVIGFSPNAQCTLVEPLCSDDTDPRDCTAWYVSLTGTAHLPVGGRVNDDNNLVTQVGVKSCGAWRSVVVYDPPNFPELLQLACHRDAGMPVSSTIAAEGPVFLAQGARTYFFDANGTPYPQVTNCRLP